MKTFKMGDRVSAYWSFSSVITSSSKFQCAESRRTTGTVLDVMNDVAMIAQDNGKVGTYHVCQLRRLVKKPRREWWLVLFADPMARPMVFSEPPHIFKGDGECDCIGLMDDGQSFSARKVSELIRVREVKK